MPATPREIIAPWNATLSGAERSLIYYILVVAGLALFAMLLRSLASKNEVLPKYRPAIYAGTGVVGVAFLSYVFLILKFDSGYTARGASFVPNHDAIWSWAPRFMDWSITVPLLVVELLAISTLTGALAKRLRGIGVVAAFLMIFTGYLGAVVIDGGTNLGALWTWGIISSVFLLILYILIVYAVLKSLPGLPAEARGTLRGAMVLLLITWFIYPIAFGFQGFTHGGGWTLTETLLLSITDVIAKVGYGSLIHKVAKLRSAADVVAGTDVHPESIYVDEEKHSDAITAQARGTNDVIPPRAGAKVR